ncbi:thiol:disulfide interchange protein [Fusobacterium necrophorum DJ-1]|uniref:Thiol:disulfide interchange protein n=3 Tax=Fusobacterium necrophorum TaxID=859 RepID=A0AB73BVF4_9FUSO|nr:thiol:disulfide interchange protein [Fusobacterium necrophorum BL]KDE64740.1 thiol:disulfide interchange protein [Fusobacterium necrophorum DJ-1]KDE65490.1 thiol:disulfide interchange protein [Fusobacterium necrophorum BFTR-1]KDE66192.1 thiol:disulfide interchange protein [Fusobacterium necrophorum DAB]KDE70728.1 thiol:disulfide interchange protein [Fusobacterium necrophorum DJ-2]MBR8734932.1 Thiol-disulfide oxidoreductase ResA [Fusobacterium necrophorum]SQD09285.1 Thiol-disulfide oxidored
MKMKYVKIFFLSLLFTLISTALLSIPLDNMDQNGNVTLPNIELLDQYKTQQSLDHYKGKVIVLTFWVTWCKDCMQEMPEMEKLYKEYGENKKEVIFLGVVNPKSDVYSKSRDRVYKKEILEYIKQNNYSIPSLFDETGEVYNTYEIEEYPSTFIINKENYLKFYIKGRVDKEELKQFIDNTLAE